MEIDHIKNQIRIPRIKINSWRSCLRVNKYIISNIYCTDYHAAIYAYSMFTYRLDTTILKIYGPYWIE